MSDPVSKMNRSTESRNRQPDHTDISSVYVEVRAALMRFASRYLKKPQDIEDVVQEAYVKTLEAQTRRHIYSPKSYLFRTTKNMALKELNKSAYRLTDNIGELLDERVIEDSPSVEEQYESRQKFELFCRAVRELPVKCRRVFILRRVYDFTTKEIAARLGISVKTVEAHLAKGIIRCTEYMDAEEYMGQQSRSKVKRQRQHG